MATDNDRPFETLNKFVVGATTAGVIQISNVRVLPFRMSHEDALNLAAWLVVCVGDRERFDKILDAVERS